MTTPSVYVDTSALLKRWLGEVGNSAGARMFDDPQKRFVTSHLTLVEISSAINRRIRMTELSVETGHALLNPVFQDLETFVGAGKLGLYSINETVVAASVQCLRRCGMLNLALRSLDALHIATAMTVVASGPVSFLSADKQQYRAAQALGLASELI